MSVVIILYSEWSRMIVKRSCASLPDRCQPRADMHMAHGEALTEVIGRSLVKRSIALCLCSVVWPRRLSSTFSVGNSAFSLVYLTEELVVVPESSLKGDKNGTLGNFTQQLPTIYSWMPSLTLYQVKRSRCEWLSYLPLVVVLLVADAWVKRSGYEGRDMVEESKHQGL